MKKTGAARAKEGKRSDRAKKAKKERKDLPERPTVTLPGVGETELVPAGTPIHTTEVERDGKPRPIVIPPNIPEGGDVEPRDQEVPDQVEPYR